MPMIPFLLAAAALWALRAASRTGAAAEGPSGAAVLEALWTERKSRAEAAVGRYWSTVSRHSGDAPVRALMTDAWSLVERVERAAVVERALITGKLALTRTEGRLAGAALTDLERANEELFHLRLVQLYACDWPRLFESLLSRDERAEVLQPEDAAPLDRKWLSDAKSMLSLTGLKPFAAAAGLDLELI